MSGISVLQTSQRKRSRSGSWDVAVSLDELVEWDALEQFMSDMPAELGMSGPTNGNGAGLRVDQPGGLMGNRAAQGASGGGQRQRTDGRTPTAVPGAWPPFPAMLSDGIGGGGLGAGNGNGSGAGGLGGPGMTNGVGGFGGAGGFNASSLAHSLYPSWQQGSSLPMQALPMERGVSWGAELLPFLDDIDGGSGLDRSLFEPGLGGLSARDLLMDGGMGGIGGGLGGGMGGGLGGGGGADGGGNGGNGRPQHKVRFVWTSELHRRFEAAVNTLGIDHAKPQAISQLMNCEGEGAPTRQNIKSHLQKYRLLMQKRARQGGTGGSSSDAAGGSAAGGGSFSESGGGGAGGAGAPSDRHTEAQAELEAHFARQEMNLKLQVCMRAAPDPPPPPQPHPRQPPPPHPPTPSAPPLSADGAPDEAPPAAARAKAAAAPARALVQCARPAAAARGR